MKNTWRELREMDRNVWIRFIGETLNGIAMMMLMPFFALYLKDKVDSLFTGRSDYGAVSNCCKLWINYGGRIADIYGRKPIMIFSMASNAVFVFGFLFIEGFIPYAILSVFLGLSNSLFHPAASAMVADVTAPEKRTEAYGLLRMGHNIGCCNWSDNGGFSSYVIEEPCVYYCRIYDVILCIACIRPYSRDNAKEYE